MEIVTASIITIGDELLIGQVVDTNSAWMAQELNKDGIWVNRRVAVGDTREDILEALETESKHSQIILITGGLGATADDITKSTLLDYFGGKLVVNQEALDNVTRIFTRVLNRPVTERNLQQAEVPDNCTVIQNKRGIAPGMWFEKEGHIFIAMPGVPHEMKGMVTDFVLPAIRQHFRLPFIAHRTLLTAGIGESYLADHIKTFEEALPPFIKLAYLPNFGLVRLRLTVRGEDAAGLEDVLQQQFDRLKELVVEWMVTDEDRSLEEAIGRMLAERGKTLGLAESCTGGYIAHLITSIPGSSHYFRGGVVSYANEVKNEILHVRPETLATSGAVSEETVREMVRGALDVLGCDYAIATSGIMGPDGGTPEKPVGTVWMAAGSLQHIVTQKSSFRFDRRRNIEITAANALNLLRKFILD